MIALDIFQLIAVFIGGTGILIFILGVLFIALILLWEYAMVKRQNRIGIDKTHFILSLDRRTRKQGKESKVLRGMVKGLKKELSEVKGYIPPLDLKELIKVFQENSGDVLGLLKRELGIKTVRVPLVGLKKIDIIGNADAGAKSCIGFTRDGVFYPVSK